MKETKEYKSRMEISKSVTPINKEIKLNKANSTPEKAIKSKLKA
tara:strand:+ start:901 stop:1032 length:132 start_codon:yes stop_codon:yes gene_type:complete